MKPRIGIHISPAFEERRRVGIADRRGNSRHADKVYEIDLVEIPMKRIAVIEDGEIVRTNLLEMVLENYTTRGAGDGAMGVSLIAEFHPDLIVSDVSMPETDGHEVLRVLKEMETTREIPFLIAALESSPGEVGGGDRGTPAWTD